MVARKTSIALVGTIDRISRQIQMMKNEMNDLQTKITSSDKPRKELKK